MFFAFVRILKSCSIILLVSSESNFFSAVDHSSFHSLSASIDRQFSVGTVFLHWEQLITPFSCFPWGFWKILDEMRCESVASYFKILHTKVAEKAWQFTSMRIIFCYWKFSIVSVIEDTAHFLQLWLSWLQIWIKQRRASCNFNISIHPVGYLTSYTPAHTNRWINTLSRLHVSTHPMKLVCSCIESSLHPKWCLLVRNHNLSFSQEGWLILRLRGKTIICGTLKVN